MRHGDAGKRFLEPRTHLREEPARRVQELERAETGTERALEEPREHTSRQADHDRMLAVLLEHTHMMAVFLDSRFNFVWVNRAYAETCRLEPSFFPGKNHFDLYPNEENRAVFQRVVDTGEPFFIAAKPFTFPDQPERGETFWDWSLVPVKDAGGRVEGLVFTLAEVTKRVRTEQALARSERNYRTLADFTYDWECWMAPDGRYAYVSPSCLRVTGHAAEAFLGDPDLFVRIVHPEDRPSVAEHLRTACSPAGGETVLPDFRLNSRSGQERWISHVCQPVFDEAGRFLGRRASNRDVTDRRRTEQMLRESERKFSDIFHAAREGILIHDTAFDRLLDANDAAVRMLGYASREELLAVRVAALRAGDDRHGEEAAQAHIRSTLADGQRVFEWPTRKKSGETFPAEVSLTRTRIRGEECVLAVVRDISHRKEAEEVRAELEAKHRQFHKAQSLGRMAGSVAHHFNNQMAVVLGNLELAAADLADGRKPVRLVDEAMKAARRAADLSGRLLVYLGQTTGKRERLDVSAFCRTLVPSLEAALPEGVRLETDLADPGLTIRANAEQMHRLLSNLAANAAEAIAPGRGTVRLRVRRAGAGEVPGKHRYPVDWEPRQTGYASVEISDPGCGIPEGDIERLFDPFYSSKSLGRGLGLPVVLGILRAHEGAVAVESLPGRGSTFRVLLPLCPAEAAQPAAGGGTAALAASLTGKVLVVDDEEAVRRVAADMLRHLGLSVLVAEDGRQALDLLRRHRQEIACVLCDLTMPGMNGWETLAAVRGLCPGLPFILASGYEEGKVMDGAHPERPDAFLHKPYSVAQLADLLGRRSPRQP